MTAGSKVRATRLFRAVTQALLLASLATIVISISNSLLGREDNPETITLGIFLSHWTWDPIVLLPLLFISVAYIAGRRRLRIQAPGAMAAGRTFYMAAALITLFLALVSPIDTYATDLLSIHMAQHLLLMMVAAPLLLLANPMATILWGLPAAWRLDVGRRFTRHGFLRRLLQVLTRPRLAWFTFAGVTYLWHIPNAYDTALRYQSIHYLQHLTMFGAGLLFWWPVIGAPPVRSRLSYPARWVYLLLAAAQTVPLGIMLTFSSTVWFPSYTFTTAAWGIAPLEDQHLGGLIMWVGGKTIHVLALTVLFFAWCHHEEDQQSEPAQRYLSQQPGL